MTIVVVPPVVTFCVVGALAYFWMFIPAALLILQIRRFSYQRMIYQRNNLFTIAQEKTSPRTIFLTELVVALFCRFLAILVLLWGLQTSFTLGVGVWKFGSHQYFRILEFELEERLQWSAYWNSVLGSRFERLCLLSQLFF
jgi:fatty acid desaturase